MNQAEKDSRRSYQDTPHPDFRKHVGIWADLERLRPRGDCVVIRLIPEPEMHANLIWIPERARGSDNAPRIGEVVAIGRGDRLFNWTCATAGCETAIFTTFKAPTAKCQSCGRRDWILALAGHHPMHVKPGDWVYYWRVFANQVEINDQVFQFVREEAHVLAVIEKGDVTDHQLS